MQRCKGKHIRTGEEFAIKIHHKDIVDVLKHEAKIYKYLQGIIKNLLEYLKSNI